MALIFLAIILGAFFAVESSQSVWSDDDRMTTMKTKTPTTTMTTMTTMTTTTTTSITMSMPKVITVMRDRSEP